MPTVRQRVAKAVDGALRVRVKSLCRGKEHAGRSQRHESRARLHNAHANRRGRVVTAPARDDDIFREPPARRDLRPQPAGDLRTFDQPRHLRAIKPRRTEQRVGPIARGDVQPAGPGRIRHLRDMLPGQPEPQVVLGEQHLGDLLEDMRLVAAHPVELGRGEARKDDVAGDLAKLRIGIERRGLGMAARIIPQHAGAQHLAGGIKQRRAMHLPRKANAPYGAGVDPVQKRGDCRFGGGDPIRRILFRPAVMRPVDRQLRAGFRQDRLVVINRQGLDARCSEVQPDHYHSVLPPVFCPDFATRCPKPGANPDFDIRTSENSARKAN